MERKVQENIIGDAEKIQAASGHITVGMKISGKEFIAKYAYEEDDYLVFITKTGMVIKNRKDLLISLKVVA
jgi:hypothetical protein